MRRLLVTIGILPLLLTVGLAGPASAEPVEGFIEADAPVTLEGSVHSDLSDATFWIQNPQRAHPESPIVLHADRLEITRKVYEVRSAHSPITNTSADVPPARTETERTTLENATIEVSALGPRADVLFAPVEDGTLLVDAGGASATIAAHVAPEGMLVRDGYREMHNIREDEVGGEGREFHYKYEIEEPLVSLAGAPAVGLAGTAQGYIWDAHLVAWNDTRTVEYETGARIQSEAMGTTQEEHYEYVLLGLDGLNATLEPSGLDARLMTKAMRAEVRGSALLPDPSGTLTGDEGVYRTDTRAAVTVDGNLSVALTPGPLSTEEPRLTVGVTGDLEAISVPLIDDENLVPTKGVVAAGAGGATLLGLTAWYLISVKGAGLAVPLARPKDGEEERGEAIRSVDRPSELLFDPDRFSLYHLVRSRAGLSAGECRRLTGIDEAAEQLDLLVEHDLLEVLSEDP